MRTRLALIALLPSPALAHAGDHADLPPTHALTAADHLAVLVTVIVVIGLAATAWVRR